MGAGTREKAGYNLIYRGFNHGRVKAVCELLSAVVLNRNLQRQLGWLAVSSAVRDFADIFAYAQDERHRADYDPLAEFTIVEATDVVDAAQIALDAFDRIEADELADVLALMLTNVRG